MSKGFPRTMSRLIEGLARMPGIGPRSAQRLAFYMLQAPAGDIEELIKNIRELKEKISFCKVCNNLSDSEVCAVCSDPSRDKTRILVVEVPGGVVSMEKAGVYNGTYHVLLGELSPIEGVGPEDIRIQGLIDRIKKGRVNEVIVGTDFTTEGETTALYLAEALRPLKVKVSRLSRGVPVGGTIENADLATIQRAFEERR